jgi:hypothetical protein
MAAHAAKERLSKARHRIDVLVHRAGMRGRGATEGDATSTLLDQLGPEWRRFDDIRWPGQSFANIDHVLIGPPGLFVIDTRKWSRSIHLSRDAHRHDAARQAIIDGVAAAAHAVGSLLGMTHRRPIPTICFVGGPEIDTAAGPVMLCSATNIVSRLQSMIPSLDREQVLALAEQVRKRLLPATGQLGTLPGQRAR